MTATLDWLPQLPPVPMSMGMKPMSTEHTARESSKLEMTMPVKVAESISSISQGSRLLTVSHTPERR